LKATSTRRLPEAVRKARQDARRLRLERRAALIGAGVAVGTRSKFSSVETTYRGMTFKSLGEAEYAAKLDMLVKAGEIVDWEQPRGVPVDDRCLICGASARLPCRTKTGSEMVGFHKQRMTYQPDFYVIPRQGYSYYVDYKGRDKRTGKTPTETPIWRRKVIQWRKNVPFELRVAYPDGTEKVVARGDEAYV
jgi:hypothetical protein